jgi:uncharacterized protein
LKDAPGDAIMIIPADKLTPEALHGIIHEFVTREGTDYGHAETNLEAKCGQVRRQLESGDVVIVFDPDDGTCNLVRRHDLPPELAPTSPHR